MILTIAAFLVCLQDPIVIIKKAKPLPFHRWAAKPPLGWNSWDCYGTSITEAQFRANVEVMAKKLRPFGWEYATVDIQWYEPKAKGFDYNQNAELTMDGYGRLLPAPNRFPSAVKGTGFKSLADWVHSKGLKFGIHLLRGVPRQAVDKELPIFGTKFKCSEIADRTRIGDWNTDMYGVDMSKKGAQEYYDSVFKQIAAWGVDFVKVDDLSKPYQQNQPEIEAIRKAIDKTKRPIVLSMSPGETDIEFGGHALTHSNMWRISDDFWDSWPALMSQFDRLNRWNEYQGPGHFPDADMLPIGTLANGTRTTNLTRDEQYTLMSLWAIAKSPLIIGADMTKMDSFTEALLTNPGLLAINQNSFKNKLIYNNKGVVVWSAEDPVTKDRYAAVFNTYDQYDISYADLLSEGDIITRETPGQGLPIIANLEGYSKIALVVADAGDGHQSDHAVWVKPTVELTFGTVIDLSIQPWKAATVGFGEPSIKTAPGGKPLSVKGVPVPLGIFAHAPSKLIYSLPGGAKSFSAFAALNDSCITETEGGTVQFFIYGFKENGPHERLSRRMSFDLGPAGAKAGNKVTDIWTGQSWMLESQTTILDIPWHGVKLLKISN
jgi:alpha-galactosidase